MPRRLRAAVMLLVTFLLLLTVALPGYAARWRPADSDVTSSEVPSTTWVVAGSFQDEASACDDWDNACANTTMEDSDGDGVHRFTNTLPAATYEYKVVESGNWDNAHPANNVAFTATAGSEVRWYFLPGANNVADNVNQCIATVAGNFQDELGGNDWSPDNLRSMMWQSEPGSDWYEFMASLPAGDWEYKVARNEGWDENYPADNVALSLTEATEILFRYNCATNEVEHTVNTPPMTNWVVVGDFQDDLPSASCGDWDNACAQTTMEDSDGDGVHRFTNTLPAATYEYKVVESGNWDNAHPANNVAFTATAGSEVRWYFLSGANRVADNVNQCIATVAGSFQAQLGGNDWAPDNLRSMMWQSEPGSDWYEFTASLPAGDWEYKVARDEDWAESYPDSNVSLSLAALSNVTFRYNCATNEVLHSVSSDADLAQPVLQHPVQDDVLYFLIPDRFNNGDNTNNCGDYAGTCVENDTEANVLTHGYLANDRGYYHGGDIAGLRAKLDYLEQMGVTALWVGPIFKNKPVQEDSSNLYGHSSGYHGYWITDFMNVDPHLGTNAEFQSLVDEAHARGINVFMDIITNHTADVIKFAEDNYAYRNKTESPWLDVDGNPFDDLTYAYYGQADYSFPQMNLNGFPYTPVVADGEPLKNPAWLNDPLNYHNRGNTSFTNENSIYGDFFGLDDLFTAKKEVTDGMIDIYKHWIEEFGVDGFRIDTTKHVNMEFWQLFGPEIEAAAKAEGIDHFFAFGEVYDQQYGPSFLSEFSTKGKLQSTIDFAFQLEARNFASKSEPTDNLKTLFEMDDYYIDANSNAYAMPTFIGNHDMGRIGYFLAQDNAGAADGELLARSQLAHALMFFARGQPVIYYGDEQGFVGDGGDKLARQDMFPSLVPEYNDDDLIGSNATTADDNFDATHPIYQSMITMTSVYSDHLALRRGAQIHRYSSDAAGIYAFSRINRDEKVEYLVAFNNAESASSADVPTFYPAGTQFDLILSQGGASAARASQAPMLMTDADGNLSLNVPALGVVIYKASSMIPATDEAPSISIGNLSNDQQVELTIESQDGHDVVQRLEVAADLGADLFAEVTFVVKASDAPTYTLIGVDDNPPYRVFYDVSDLPEGTTLDFKVIVNDLHGHYNSATVTGIAPMVQQPQVPTATGYAIIHYYRADGDYGDHTTGDYNDYWGLHLWGNAIDDSEGTDWTTPKPFLGEDEYGRFAWIKLKDPTQDLNFIIHRGDTKDGTDEDRKFNPTTEGPQIWTKQGDGDHYTNQADGQGVVTIHYQRPGGDYGDYTSDDYNDFWGLHLWTEQGGLTDWTTPKKADGQDEYGVYFTIVLTEYEAALGDFDIPLNFIVHKGDVKDPADSPDRAFEPSQNSSIWLMQDDLTIHASRGSAEGYATIHYHRPDGDYGDPTSDDFNDFWGMHVWTGAANPNPGWQQPLTRTAQDAFGIYFEVALTEDADQLAYILHKGDEKDPGPDQFLTLATHGYEVWQLQDADPDNPYILPILSGAASCAPNIESQSAHWVSQDTIAWKACDISESYHLNYAPHGGMTLGDDGISGGMVLTLTRDSAGLSSAITDKFPHLADYDAFKVAADDLALVPEILKGQILLSSRDSEGNAADATGLQIPGVLDDLYASNAMSSSLGVVFHGAIPSLSVWAPTAKSVTLHRFADASTTTSITGAMTLDSATGIWSITGDASWNNQFYLYEVEVYVPATGQVEHNIVTDPYAISLSMNSQRSQIVDFNDPALKPADWDTLAKPALAAPEDVALYELHMRDFSVNDSSVAEEHQGKFTAFTLTDTHGMKHLRDLAEAGLTHIHLLPVFDIATINENPAERTEPTIPADAGPDSEDQQAAVTAVEDQDAFNWGYDPYHYTVPEGSYSSDPNGSARIMEFRQMVKSLNQNGLRVVMDVVYNHTNASGQADKSVLDKVVPGYYHRLNDTGQVETSTCCENTATEHAMMEKLMVDSLQTWATAYKVDGFRFDLMGHHMVSNMVAVSDTLHGLTMAEDGVDGSKIYLYGEGWNFGEVENGVRGENATQLNVGGLGIGTFNDRLRDAVRGGGPFDGGDNLKLQGFINGLSYDSNDFDQGDQQAKLLLYQDQIRVGLAANLADYSFTDRTGNQVTGKEVDYNGAPAGYTEDPQEHIVYASAHDNQSLFDIIQYKAPQTATTDARARMQNMGLSVVCLSQGVPFFHAGSEMQRSKSLDRDSYNSGDWFNKLDFTYQSNNWAVGLPVAGKNADNWDIMRPLLANLPAPAQSDILKSVNHFQECLKIRKSSPLFRLQSASEVQNRVQFHNTGPQQLAGLIVMSISDKVEPDLDANHEQIVALFNANDEAQTIQIASLTGSRLQLHALQAASSDPVVKTATFDSATGTFSVPARTTAIFVEPEDNDGVPNETEDGVPNPDGSGTGDGNGDGMPDSEQENVASLPNQGTGNDQGYVTLESPAGTRLVEVMTMPAPAQMPEGVEQMPQGMFDFSISGVTTETVMLTLTLHAADTVLDTYYKQNQDGSWYEFLYTDTTGAQITTDAFSNTIITLRFVDGQRGDADGIVNGVINDPGAPGTRSADPTSVQLTRIEGTSDGNWPFALLATLSLAAGLAYWYRRRK
ncbi:MAG: pullulanase-type alpha-1,6-glucosidase [Ardenticatenaceae bacterium]